MCALCATRRLQVITFYRDDLTVRQHPLFTKLPAVTSFRLQFSIRVGSTSPFITVVNVYRPPSTDLAIFVHELAVAIICCCSEMSTARLDDRLSTSFMEFGLTQHVTLLTRSDLLLHVVVDSTRHSTDAQ